MTKETEIEFWENTLKSYRRDAEYHAKATESALEQINHIKEILEGLKK